MTPPITYTPRPSTAPATATAPATKAPATPVVDWTARAQYATSSRLVCCVVNEALAPAYYVPSPSASGTGDVLGWAVLVRPDDEQQQSGVVSAEWVHDVFLPSLATTSPVIPAASDDTAVPDAILVPLRATPLLRTRDTVFPRVRSADPDDLVPVSPFLLLHPTSSASGKWTATATLDPARVWSAVSQWNAIDAASSGKIARELASSAAVQEQLYLLSADRALPTLDSPALDWEAAVLEGHATHPMHRTRSAAAPLSFAADHAHLAALADPEIRFFLVPLARVHAHGTWLADVHPHLARYLGVACPADHVLFPVHAFQVPFVRATFPEFRYLESAAIPARAQASTRTVVPRDPHAFPGASHVKLSICMTITSAMRTISPYSVHNGPVFSRMAELANEGRAVLLPVAENATLGLRHDDEYYAKTMGAVLRTDPESVLPEHERTIMCGALVERDPVSHTPHVVRAFALATHEAKLDFFHHYAATLVAAVVPPLVKYGLAWEAHGQNMLVRVDRRTRAVVGFAARDFGGCQVYPPAWRSAFSGNPAAAGLVDQFLPGSFQTGESAEAGWAVVYHTAFACHLHRLARALGVHGDARSWAGVRREIARYVVRGSPLWQAWLATREVPAKAFLRMKMDGLYRDYVYEPVPNILLTGVAEDDDLSFPELSEGEGEAVEVVAPAV
ncbi:hypothetical protein H9P43_003383 [Blastocladiella emersonii ATCC 22665]|nr:hypothetical protein H9P43_003383 [Blastocladiella emersonii ATCC 22665]